MKLSFLSRIVTALRTQGDASETRTQNEAQRVKRYERGAICLLLILGAVTHLFYLDYPSQIVFDEVGYGAGIDAYCCTRKNLFDIHPPHPKLLMAATVYWLGGYRGGIRFDKIANSVKEGRLFAFRLLPALMGLLLPCLFFLLLRRVGASLAAALLGALFVVFDDALVLQTRIIATEGFLLVGLFGSLLCALASERRRGRQRWILATAAGLLASLAFGTKFTGLLAPFLLGAYFLLCFWRDREQRRSWALAIVLASLAFAIFYLGGWWVHFHLLTKPGYGDAFYRNTGHFFTDFYQLHVRMLRSNYFLTQPHSFSSKWWGWPLMRRPIYYWHDNPNRFRMYFIGNPVVWWGSSLAMLAAVGLYVRDGMQKNRRERWGKKSPYVPLLFGCFCLAYFPYAGIPRPLFLYHYLPPLLFAIAIAALWLDRIAIARPGTLVWQDFSYFSLIATLLLGFILTAPFTYGIPVVFKQSNRLFHFLDASPWLYSPPKRSDISSTPPLAR